jgi:hypothetical protein
MYVLDNASRVLFVLAIGAAIVAAFFISPRETFSQAGTPLTGYIWSDTIGWVSLHCSDLGTCGTSNYGLTIAADGTISGYAWSEYAGWISANGADLTGCPTAPCTARMDELAMKGWMKALAANQSESGGWDGFISLSGLNYGPTLSGGTISGYAWGDMNIGWLSFSSPSHSATTVWLPACASSYVCTDATHRQNACAGASIEACSGSLICAAGACVIPPAPTPNTNGSLKVSPQLIAPGRTTTVTWDIQNATSCTVTEDNSSISDSWTGVTGTKTSSAIRQQTVYTLQCAGAGGNLTQTATVYQTPNWKEI